MKIAGTSAAGLALSGAIDPAVLGAQQAAAATTLKHHPIPTDKNLPPSWLRMLRERGSRESWSGPELETIGMPIGGIATGQLYLTGDGTLGNWEIFNDYFLLGWGPTNYAQRVITKSVVQGFAVIAGPSGEEQFRPLSRGGFAEVRFRGEYPIGIVTYEDPESPVRVEMEAFSPFIPLNAKDSALPATMFHITVENTGRRTIKASVMGWLENPVARRAAGLDWNGKRTTRLAADADGCALIHSAEDIPQKSIDDARPARNPIPLAQFEGDAFGDWTTQGTAFGSGPVKGSLPHQQQISGFEGERLVNSFHGGDDATGRLTSLPFTITRRFINLLVGGGQLVDRVGVRLLIDGAVVRRAAGQDSESLDWVAWNVAEFEGKTAVIEMYDEAAGPWGHILVDDIELSDRPRKSRSIPGRLQLFPDFGDIVLHSAQPSTGGEDFVTRFSKQLPPATIAGHTAEYPLHEEQVHALAADAIELKPGKRHTFLFVLAWYFPNTIKPDANCGHEYAARFTSAAEVSRYVVTNHARLAGETRGWRDNYYDSTLPIWLLDRIHLTVDCLATGTTMWWKSGRFWAWEGVVCCEGTCTHVWNYAHTLAHLFPELERNVRENQDLGAGFHDDGLVGFRSNHDYAADGQCGTVLKIWREHRLSSDNEFLKRNWEKTKKVLGYSIARDANEDGLIEDSQHNTYDINFHGANTFVGALYLAALRAGEEMAREVGDAEFATKARRIYESGRKLTMDRLWNGEYFIQDVDLAKHPDAQYGDGCLSDQLFGQNWAHLMGLGYLYPQQNVRTALESVWKYNWAPDVGPYNVEHPTRRPFAEATEAGLFICTWPRSAYLDKGVAYREEVWTGIEYEVAAHMILEGMIDEGLAICRAVHERYHPMKRNPYNEVECSDFYARAMASWGVLLALSGFQYHGPKQQLAFAPRLRPKDFRCAFTTAEGWGNFRQKLGNGRGEWELELRYGTLDLAVLKLGCEGLRNGGKVTVRLNDDKHDAIARLSAEGLELEFARVLHLQNGDVLEIRAT